jgi:L-arabinose isomerase
MIDLKNYEVWFVTGSQHLYGNETLQQVAEDAQAVVQGINQTGHLPVSIVYKPIVTRPEEVHQLSLEANASKNCIGLITWMHTFSPAKMWIAGLDALTKPFLHLHTQFNREIPWSTIDMDFMNLNQSAHGGREFGFIGSRMRLNRKVVVGYWQDADVLAKLDIWIRAACAWQDAQGAKIARIGDNMREVAVTEGDKVSAQIRFGYSVNGYGIGDLVAFINQVGGSELDNLIAEYEQKYSLMESMEKGGEQRQSLREAAKIELGMRAFLEDGNFKAFTDTFENLHGLIQLPGIAVQRLMADGYGFGAEGDWKTAALLRAMKVMDIGLKGGTSFMEDYTYHFEEGGGKVLGAHMLEICESIAQDRPALEIHPLGIGGKADPVRLVFSVAPGPAINAAVLDLGNRFRLVVNQVEVVEPDQPLPKLPVARAVWVPKPDLKTAAAAWILAGGSHHTGFSRALTSEYLEDFAGMAGIEFLIIDENTEMTSFKNELKWNEVYYHLSQGIH